VAQNGVRVLVLTAIAATDGAAFVVEHREVGLQVGLDLECEFAGDAVLLDEREDAELVWGRASGEV
jgi:hypothetical protein